MKLQHHISISILISTLIWWIFSSWIIALSSLASGVLIDADHGLDFLIEFRKRFTVRELIEAFNSRKLDRVRLVFHSWELLLLLVIATYLLNWNPWVAGILIGFGQHLIFDQVFNHTKGFAYFLLWRWRNGFRYSKLFSS